MRGLMREVQGGFLWPRTAGCGGGGIVPSKTAGGRVPADGAGGSGDAHRHLQAGGGGPGARRLSSAEGTAGRGTLRVCTLAPARPPLRTEWLRSYTLGCRGSNTSHDARMLGERNHGPVPLSHRYLGRHCCTVQYRAGHLLTRLCVVAIKVSFVMIHALTPASGHGRAIAVVGAARCPVPRRRKALGGGAERKKLTVCSNRRGKGRVRIILTFKKCHIDT